MFFDSFLHFWPRWLRPIPGLTLPKNSSHLCRHFRQKILPNGAILGPFRSISFFEKSRIWVSEILGLRACSGRRTLKNQGSGPPDPTPFQYHRIWLDPWRWVTNLRYGFFGGDTHSGKNQNVWGLKRVINIYSRQPIPAGNLSQPANYPSRRTIPAGFEKIWIFAWYTSKKSGFLLDTLRKIIDIWSRIYKHSWTFFANNN